MTQQTTLHKFSTLEYHRPLRTLITHAHSLLLEGKFGACLEFLYNQPAEVIDSSPKLMIIQATAMLFNECSPLAIDEVLTKAEQGGTEEHLAGEIAAIRAIISSYTDNPDQGIKLSQLALQRLNPDDTFYHNMIERNLGVAYTLKNDLKNANAWFERLLMSSCQLEDWGGVLAAYNYLTYIRKVQGRLAEANTIYQKALKFINDRGLEHLPHAIKIISGYGYLLLYWHQLKEAKTYFNRAIHWANQTDVVYAYTAYQHLCEAHIRENNIQAAKSVLQDLQHRLLGRAELHENIHLQQTQMLETRIAIEEGRIDHGYAWLRSSGLLDLPAKELFDHYGYTLGQVLPIATRVLIHKGMPDRAIHIVKAVIPQFIHQGANSFLIRALVALAIAYEAVTTPQKAVTAFNKAIALGAPEQNLGDFLYFGHSLIPLLKYISAIEQHQPFTLKLLAHLESYQPYKWVLIEHTQILPDLTAREIEVLKLMASGLTNQQIAEALFISKNTIKSHRSHIYQKLDVANRNQAIDKAARLGILASSYNAAQRSVPRQ